MSKVGQYIRSLHLNYDQPILIHITGHSNCGKTALSLIFYELISKKEVNDRPSIREITSGDKSASNVNLIMTDRFVHKIVTANPDKYDVANATKNHAGNFSNFDSNEHVRYNSLLRDAVSSNHKFVIIEGYCQFDEQQIFAGFDNIIRISTKKRGAYRLHNPKRFGFRRSRKVSAFASVSGERWEIFREKKAFKPVYDFAEQILDAIKQDVITNIVKPISKYQYFEDLVGNTAANSKSLEKYRQLNLDPKEISTWSNVLDVGCNCGYVSTRLCEQGAIGVVGLDVVGKSIRCAKAISSYVYHLPETKCRFIKQDAFDFDPGGDTKYDAIIACSVFHYFRENQFRYIELMKSKLKKNGVAIIETGISVEHSDEAFVQSYARGVDKDDPCMFPNLAWYEDVCRKLDLQITYVGESVNQRGDDIPRKVIHLKTQDA